MSKSLILKSVTGLFIPFFALAAPSPAALQCEKLSENNEICMSDAPARPATASSVSKSGSSGVSMLTREETSGGALDLENEFAVNTVLGDASGVPSRDPRMTGESQTAQARLLNVDALVHNVVFWTPQTRVGAARIKTK